LKKSTNLTEASTNETLPLRSIQLDVDNEKSVIEGIDRISEEKERIDVVVNNAGYDFIGPLEETLTDEIKAHFETNFFGTIRVMQTVIPLIRKQKRGGQ
jgi:NADP-dependent 3-hydroxy acid dehydrogenase YdfG